MDAKMKLRLARNAMNFLERAILELEQPDRLPKGDPDYDLWRATHALAQALDDASQAEQEPEFNDNDSKEVQQLIRQGR
jgi:hypothetical protein